MNAIELAKDVTMPSATENSVALPERAVGQAHSRHVESRLTKLMDRDSLDALVCVGAENIYYTTSWAPTSAYRYGATGTSASVTSRASRTVVTTAYEEQLEPVVFTDLKHVTYPTWVFIDNPYDLDGPQLSHDYVAHQGIEGCMARVIAELRELDTRGGRIGLDMQWVRLPAWQYLLEHGRDYTWVDSSALLLEARTVKSKWELDCIRKAHDITESALADTPGSLGVGSTAAGLFDVFSEACRAQSGCTGIRFALISVGPDFSPVWFPQRTVAARIGDLVRFDVGAEVLGYGADIARTFVLGRARPEVRRAYDALAAGADVLNACVRRDVTCSDLFESTVATIRESGLPNYQRGHVGHSVGLARSAEEPPQITNRLDASIEVGMVMSLETPYYGRGVGAINIENMVVIHPDGVERLTSLPMELLEM